MLIAPAMLQALYWSAGMVVGLFMSYLHLLSFFVPGLGWALRQLGIMQPPSGEVSGG